jgi:hypothetical protein
VPIFELRLKLKRDIFFRRSLHAGYREVFKKLFLNLKILRLPRKLRSTIPQVRLCRRSAEGFLLIDGQRLFWDDMTAHPRNFLPSLAKVPPHKIQCSGKPFNSFKNFTQRTQKVTRKKINVYWKKYCGRPSATSESALSRHQIKLVKSAVNAVLQRKMIQNRPARV